MQEKEKGEEDCGGGGRVGEDSDRGGGNKGKIRRKFSSGRTEVGVSGKKRRIRGLPSVVLMMTRKRSFSRNLSHAGQVKGSKSYDSLTSVTTIASKSSSRFVSVDEEKGRQKSTPAPEGSASEHVWNAVPVISSESLSVSKINHVSSTETTKPVSLMPKREDPNARTERLRSDLSCASEAAQRDADDMNFGAGLSFPSLPTVA